LVALFVEPEVIGRGIGRALLQHALDATQSAGIKSLLIESDPNAEPFYRAQGAETIGCRTSPTTGRDLALLRLPVGGGALSGHQSPRRGAPPEAPATESV
jgi:GNAT superfamily N-acetyltransferase